MEYTPRQECGKRINFYFIWYDLVSEYENTVRCNFWQPQGSHFQVKFGIGTPPNMKAVSDALPNSREPRPNRWDTYLGRNLEKRKNFNFFSA
jgi:hypothetical protein